MPPHKMSLRALERWFQHGVVGPHESRRERRSRRPARVVIHPSARLSPEERLEIYSRMYMARLHDCLREDFPAVERVAGHTAFHRLVSAYLDRFPSRHYSLNPLGRSLPEFLSNPVPFRRRELLRDVARIETAMAQVFDQEEVMPLTPADFARIPQERLGSVRVRVVPAFQLLSLDHPANAVVTAARQGKPLPRFRRRRSWVAVYRKNYRVWRLDLEEPAFAALLSLAAHGTVGDAVRAATRKWKGTPASLRLRLRRWFGGWVSEGLFSEVVC